MLLCLSTSTIHTVSARVQIVLRGSYVSVASTLISTGSFGVGLCNSGQSIHFAVIASLSLILYRLYDDIAGAMTSSIET